MMVKPRRVAGCLAVLSLALWTMGEQAMARGPGGLGRGGRAAGRAGGLTRSRGARSRSFTPSRTAAGRGFSAPSRATFPSAADAFRSGGAGQAARANRTQVSSPLHEPTGAAGQSFRENRAANLQTLRDNYATNAQNRRSDLRAAAQDAVNAWTSGPEPFTAAWYIEHPNAWKVTHPYAPSAVALTTAGIAAWLLQPVAVPGTTVVVQEEGSVTESDVQPADGDPAESPATVTAGQASPAGAENVAWLRLGVFTLYAPGETLPTRMVEIALAQDGRIGGTYFDRLENRTDTISGTVDRNTMSVRWKVGERGSIFEAPLESLTKAEATVTVRLPDGGVSQWRLVKRGS